MKQCSQLPVIDTQLILYQNDYHKWLFYQHCLNHLASQAKMHLNFHGFFCWFEPRTSKYWRDRCPQIWSNNFLKCWFSIIHENCAKALLSTKNFKMLSLVLKSNPLKKGAWIWGQNSGLKLSIDLKKVGDGGAMNINETVV